MMTASNWASATKLNLVVAFAVIACGPAATDGPTSSLPPQAIPVVTGPSIAQEERICAVTGESDLDGVRLRYWYDLYLEAPSGRILAAIWPAGTSARLDEQGLVEVEVDGVTVRSDELIGFEGSIGGDRAYICRVVWHDSAPRGGG